MLAISIPTGVAVLGIAALLLVVSSMLGGLIAPTPTYKMANANELPANDSDRFLEIVEALTDAQLNRTGSVNVLTNGPAFYSAELETIRGDAGFGK